MTRIAVEPVPTPERTPQHRYQVIVDGSVISRHATKSQARDRAREARGRPANRVKNIAERAIEASKANPPVNASLDPMNADRMDAFAAGAATKSKEPERDGGWDHLEAMAMGLSSEPEDDDSNQRRSDLEVEDPFGLGGDW